MTKTQLLALALGLGSFACSGDKTVPIAVDELDGPLVAVVSLDANGAPAQLISLFGKAEDKTVTFGELPGWSGNAPVVLLDIRVDLGGQAFDEARIEDIELLFDVDAPMAREQEADGRWQRVALATLVDVYDIEPDGRRVARASPPAWVERMVLRLPIDLEWARIPGTTDLTALDGLRLHTVIAIESMGQGRWLAASPSQLLVFDDDPAQIVAQLELPGFFVAQASVGAPGPSREILVSGLEGTKPAVLRVRFDGAALTAQTTLRFEGTAPVTGAFSPTSTVAYVLRGQQVLRLDGDRLDEAYTVAHFGAASDEVTPLLLVDPTPGIHIAAVQPGGVALVSHADRSTVWSEDWRAGQQPRIATDLVAEPGEDSVWLVGSGGDVVSLTLAHCEGPCQWSPNPQWGPTLASCGIPPFGMAGRRSYLGTYAAVAAAPDHVFVALQSCSGVGYFRPFALQTDPDDYLEVAALTAGGPAQRATGGDAITALAYAEGQILAGTRDGRILISRW